MECSRCKGTKRVPREVLVKAIRDAKQEVEDKKKWLEWASIEIPKYENELVKGDARPQKRSGGQKAT
jgi:hypothetical protein